MSENINTGRGIPLAVTLRRYLRHAIIAVITLAAYALLFAFIGNNAVGSTADLSRAKNAPHNEIIFSQMPNGKESFLYLKNYSVKGETDENALSDVFMLLQGSDYGENLFGFFGKLDAGTCAVSANIASAYGLSVGDTATVMTANKSFTVAKTLDAQSGIDEKYLHEGIIILAYDEELLDRAYSYVSFDTDGDGYLALDTLVFTNDLAVNARGTLLLCALIALLAIAAVLIVSEIFLSRPIREDYITLVLLGRRGVMLYLSVLAETAAKYILPAALISALNSARFSCYGRFYAVPVLCFIGITAIITVIYSTLVFRRSYYVRAK